MQRDEALQEVREIRRIMSESRRRSRSSQPLVAVAIILLGAVLSIFVPPLAIVLGIGLLVGGVVAYRRSDDALGRGAAAAAIAIGAVLTLFMVLIILGLAAGQGTGEMGGPSPVTGPEPLTPRG